MTDPCCEAMRRQLEHRCDSCGDEGCPDQVVVYEPAGDYAIPIRDGGGSQYVISFCPWCGSELPVQESTPRPDWTPPAKEEPVPATDEALAARLQARADETDSAADHDELHAAADVVASGLHTRYVDRWVDELRKRWLDTRPDPANGETR